MTESAEEYLKELESSNDPTDQALAEKIRQAQWTTVIPMGEAVTSGEVGTKDATRTPVVKTPRKVPPY